MMNWREEKQMDASIAELMRACANDEGAMLRDSYKNAAFQPLPTHMDDAYKKLIEKSFSQQQKRIVVNHIVKAFCMTLLCLFGLLGVGTVTVMSVESLREPVRKVFDDYYIRITNEELSIGSTSNNGLVDGTEVYGTISTDVLLRLLPDGYEYFNGSGEDLQWFTAIYTGGKYGEVAVISYRLGASTNVNTEDAWLLEEIELRGYSGYLICSDDNKVVNWIDEERNVFVSIWAERISIEELVDLAERFIDQLPPPESQLSE